MSDFLDLQGAKDLNTDAIHIGAVANSKDPVTGSPIDTHVNRAGDADYTLQGFWNALGPVVMPWTSVTGGTLTQPNQAFLHPTDGNYYSWGGAYPAGGYVVAPGTNPVVVAGYVPRTDVVLRSQLSQTDGANLVGGATYAQIRAYAGSATRMYCLGRSNISDGANGYFHLSSTDTISADNGGTILVDANGGRWIRQFSGSADIRWWGANPDQGSADDTAAFAAAINFSSLTKVAVHVPYTATPYHVTGLDFKGKDGAKLIGSVGSEYNYPQIKTIGAASITVDGLTVFVRINDSVSVSTREVSLKNFVLLEDSSSLRNRGLLVVGAPQTTIDSITLYGFDRSLRAARLWNAKLNYIHCYKFRTSGFSSGEGNASYGSTNGIELLSFHASSDINPAVNIDCRGANSLTFVNLTTEGSCVSHFLVDATTRSVNIHGIHKEGGRNFVEVDLDTFSATVPFGNFSVFGGAIFIDSPSMATGDKFVKPTGTRVNVGLQSLTLNAESISKPTLAVAPAFPSDYFDMSRVAVLDTTATFNTVVDAAVDRMTWGNVGKYINAGFLTGQFGHNGLPTNNYRGVYSGVRGERILTSLASAASLAAGYQVALIDTDDLLEVTLDIEVELQYNSGAFNASNFLARFIGHITNSGAIVVTKVYENGLYAKDTTFAYDRTTRALTATNATGFGTFRLKTKISKW